MRVLRRGRCVVGGGAGEVMWDRSDRGVIPVQDKISSLACCVVGGGAGEEARDRGVIPVQDKISSLAEVVNVWLWVSGVGACACAWVWVVLDDIFYVGFALAFRRGVCS